ncbi:hypothetical protein H7904_07985 [Staphylococcus capitis]|uniref:Lipoprotein n=1 Tax=Staphylococcus capitis TaxID=29388 RepID=A0A7Z8E2R5_STACP|nr:MULTISPECIES: hypothetical protein [Staphylococcus]MBC3080603.1 hypothetical protein [Staphylococcus capitis]MBC8780432.1 hypothetical protein [Staphylococcus capitis]MBE7321007.1 hypothetical protein [Staphylococcus capitis]MBU5291462.1 hypothetical protein [Staphylococcus capitis]MCC3690427.1 hypothetical protein [Staphylococcus capitis]
MKRLFASITVLTLILAACSHSGSDENEKNDDSSKKEQKEKKSKTDSKDKSKNHKDKDSTSKSSSNNELSSSDSQTENTNTSKQQPQSNQDNSKNKDYVAPYQSNHATQVARSLSPFNGNEGQALQQLPNFETALDIAKNEANMFGNSHKKYNDYSLEATNDGFRYVFSFKDASKDNSYSIVTVNRQGQPTLIDPNYHQ